MMHITYFVHGTTQDNMEHLASGQNDIHLGERGIQESHKLNDMTKDRNFDVIFLSDLSRAIETAEIAFGKRNIQMVKDARLREIDYGDLTQRPTKDVYPLMPAKINEPFPNGESCKDVEKRIREFLEDAKKEYDGKHIAIVCHKTPQLAIEVITQGKTWEQAIKDDWRLKNPKAWKPGWKYEF